jgi:hypothetical protein
VSNDVADVEAAHAEARQLEADNPLWIVVFGISSREFVCFSRASVPFRAIVFARDSDTLPPRMRAIENSALIPPERRDDQSRPQNPINPLRTETHP